MRLAVPCRGCTNSFAGIPLTGVDTQGSSAVWITAIIVYVFREWMGGLTRDDASAAECLLGIGTRQSRRAETVDRFQK